MSANRNLFLPSKSLSSQTPFLLRDKIALFDKYPPKLHSSTDTIPSAAPTLSIREQKHNERVQKLIKKSRPNTASHHSSLLESRIFKQISLEAASTSPIDSDYAISVPVLDFTSAERGSISYRSQTSISNMSSARTDGFQTARLTKSSSSSARSTQPFSSSRTSNPLPSSRSTSSIENNKENIVHIPTNSSPKGTVSSPKTNAEMMIQELTKFDTPERNKILTGQSLSGQYTETLLSESVQQQNVHVGKFNGTRDAMKQKLHEMTLIFQDKIKRQYNIMRRDVEIEEKRHREELNRLKYIYEDKMYKLALKYETLKEENKNLSKMYEELEESADKANELEKNKEELWMLKQNLFQLEQKNSSLNEENEKHKEEIEALKDLISQLRSENELIGQVQLEKSQEETIKEYEDLVEEWRQQVGRLTEMNEEQLKEIEKLKQEIQLLKQQRNSLSLPPSSKSSSRKPSRTLSTTDFLSVNNSISNSTQNTPREISIPKLILVEDDSVSNATNAMQDFKNMLQQSSFGSAPTLEKPSSGFESTRSSPRSSITSHSIHSARLPPPTLNTASLVHKSIVHEFFAKLFDDLFSLLHCPLCQNQLNNPHILFCCGHNYCRECIEILKSNNYNKDTSMTILSQLLPMLSTNKPYTALPLECVECKLQRMKRGANALDKVTDIPLQKPIHNTVIYDIIQKLFDYKLEIDKQF